jgi:DNA replication protein DnaC
LQPSELSKLKSKKQEQVIKFLQANPTMSYAFFGPAGTSKTTFSVALYENVVWDSVAQFTGVHIPIFRLSAKSLMDEFVVRETDRQNAPEPTITRDLIKKISRRMDGTKPDDQTTRLFLEEIDKVRYSEFKTASIFEVIDALYEHNGQFVFTSNLTVGDFSKQFFRPSDAEAVIRRIGEMGRVFDFYEEGWVQPEKEK